MLFASCIAILVKNLPVWLISLPPLKKKKLAPRRSFLQYLLAMVRAIVDFPVPAKLLSQNIHRSSCPLAQSHISCSMPTRVLGRQMGSSWQLAELKGASMACGKEWSRSLSNPYIIN